MDEFGNIGKRTAPTTSVVPLWVNTEGGSAPCTAKAMRDTLVSPPLQGLLHSNRQESGYDLIFKVPFAPFS